MSSQRDAALSVKRYLIAACFALANERPAVGIVEAYFLCPDIYDIPTSCAATAIVSPENLK
jgi:hypothetical protein